MVMYYNTLDILATIAIIPIPRLSVRSFLYVFNIFCFSIEDRYPKLRNFRLFGENIRVPNIVATSSITTKTAAKTTGNMSVD